MEFEVRLASDYEFSEMVNITTIEDLKRLSERFNRDLIVSFDKFDRPSEIIVYDDYVE